MCAVPAGPRDRESEHDSLGAIAVVGYSVTFPGDATDAKSFWKILMEKRNTATPFPEDRMNTESIYHPDANRKGQVSGAWKYKTEDM